MTDDVAGAGHAAPRPLPRARGHHHVPGDGLELGAVRRLELCTSRRTRARRPRSWRRRDRYGAHVEGEIEGVKGVEDDVGSDEERRGPVRSRWRSEFIADDRRRRVRAGDRERARACTRSSRKLDAQRVTDIVERRADPDGAARRHRHDRRAVHRPDRPRLRQGEHLDRAEDRVHRLHPRVPARPNPGKYDPALAVQARASARSGRWPSEHIRTFGSAGKARKAVALMPALIFDCDGVLADTERDGHLPAFNQTFAEFGPAGALVRGGVRREAADRRRQGADGAAC